MLTAGVFGAIFSLSFLSKNQMFGEEGKLTNEELEFISEETLIDIIPKITIPRLHFITGTIGPITPNIQTSVPLWFALKLRKAGKCSIVIPEYLRAESLQQTLQREKQESTFVALPDYYIAICMQLVKFASQDWPEQEEHTVRQLFENVQNVRLDKINHGLIHGLMQQPGAIIGYQLNNITPMEIQRIRKMVNLLLTKLARISAE